MHRRSSCVGLMKASLTLMSKLEAGEKSAREKGWLSADEVEDDEQE